MSSMIFVFLESLHNWFWFRLNKVSPKKCQSKYGRTWEKMSFPTLTYFHNWTCSDMLRRERELQSRQIISNHDSKANDNCIRTYFSYRCVEAMSNPNLVGIWFSTRIESRILNNYAIFEFSSLVTGKILSLFGVDVGFWITKNFERTSIPIPVQVKTIALVTKRYFKIPTHITVW